MRKWFHDKLGWHGRWKNIGLIWIEKGLVVNRYECQLCREVHETLILKCELLGEHAFAISWETPEVKEYRCIVCRTFKRETRDAS